MYSFVYMTAPNEEEAEKLGTLLVKSRLAACVNMIPGMRSIYSWKGKIEKSEEIILIAKTRKLLVPKVMDLVKKHHSYEVPCIMEIPINSGLPDFLRWIDENTEI